VHILYGKLLAFLKPNFVFTPLFQLSSDADPKLLVSDPDPKLFVADLDLKCQVITDPDPFTDPFQIQQLFLKRFDIFCKPFAKFCGKRLKYTIFSRKSLIVCKN